MAMTAKTVFCDVTSCNLMLIHDPEKSTASIFGVESFTAHSECSFG
jgi:hypothetical protein